MTEGPNPIAVIVHQFDNDLGRFRPLLEAHGPGVLEIPIEDLEGFDLDDPPVSGIVSLGGDMCALDDRRHPALRRELNLLTEAHEREVPVLGLCLGGQLLARALGGSVERGGGKELGWIDVEVLQDDPLLGRAGVSPRLLWHSDSFEAPPDATILARGEASPHQAFRMGGSYGIQFHPEATLDQVKGWTESEWGAADLAEAGIEASDLLAESRRLEPLVQEAAVRIVGGFLDICTGVRKP